MVPRVPTWPSCDAPPALAANEIHVWRADVRQCEPYLPRLRMLLDTAEKARAARFVAEPPRQQFTVARAMLRHLLGQYLTRPPGNFRFAFGPSGKPCLCEPATTVKFNVSHSGNEVLLAFARNREVGVDVEHLHQLQARDAVAERFYTLPEAARIQALPLADGERAFFHHWVRKEAFVKAVGKGIASGLSAEVEVLDRADEPPPAPRLVREPHEGKDWKLFSFELAPEYLGALSAAEEDWTPLFLAWEPGSAL